jgi:hypothetical protein
MVVRDDGRANSTERSDRQEWNALSERIVTFAGITTRSIPVLANESAPRKVRESGKLIVDKKQQQEKANEPICESREGRIIECKVLDLNDFS